MSQDDGKGLGLSDISVGAAAQQRPTQLAQNEKDQLERDQKLALEGLKLKVNSQDLGILGKIFGSGRHAKSNIAGFTILMSVFALFFMLYYPVEDKALQANVMEIFKSVLMASIGFFLAAATDKDK